MHKGLELWILVLCLLWSLKTLLQMLYSDFQSSNVVTFRSRTVTRRKTQTELILPTTVAIFTLVKFVYFNNNNNNVASLKIVYFMKVWLILNKYWQTLFLTVFIQWCQLSSKWTNNIFLPPNTMWTYNMNSKTILVCQNFVAQQAFNVDWLFMHPFCMYFASF